MSEPKMRLVAAVLLQAYRDALLPEHNALREEARRFIFEDPDSMCESFCSALGGHIADFRRQVLNAR